MLIYIGYLDRTELIYALWQNARWIQHCAEFSTSLQLKKKNVKRDLNIMCANGRPLLLTTYYGKMLFADVTRDFFDTTAYDVYNGSGLARKIIDQQKHNALHNTILHYYKSL